MVNTEVKGTLAKLLATENLNIEHRQVETAYFDVQNRILCLPIWKNVSNSVMGINWSMVNRSARSTCFAIKSNQRPQ